MNQEEETDDGICFHQEEEVQKCQQFLVGRAGVPGEPLGGGQLLGRLPRDSARGTAREEWVGLVVVPVRRL